VSNPLSPDCDDAILVRACLKGEREAHALLLARYRDRIYGFILRMLRDRGAAEDLAQEVFIKAFRSLSSYDQERPFIPWLFRIARNAVIDYTRKRKADIDPIEFDLPDASPSVEDVVASKLEVELVEKMLGALPFDFREALLLHLGEGLGYAEMSEVLGVPVGTLKARVSRAREMLRKKCNPEPESP